MTGPAIGDRQVSQAFPALAPRLTDRELTLALPVDLSLPHDFFEPRGPRREARDPPAIPHAPIVAPFDLGPFVIRPMGDSRTLDYGALSIGGNTLSPPPSSMSVTAMGDTDFGRVAGLSFTCQSDGWCRTAATVGGLPVVGGLSVGYTRRTRLEF